MGLVRTFVVRLTSSELVNSIPAMCIKLQPNGGNIPIEHSPPENINTPSGFLLNCSSPSASPEHPDKESIQSSKTLPQTLLASFAATRHPPDSPHRPSSSPSHILTDNQSTTPP